MSLSDKAFKAYVKQQLNLKVDSELVFHPTRKWRYDFAIIEHKIAIEVEGGVWTNGRHTRGKGFIEDIEKYNAGTTLGWRILRVTPENLLKQNTLDLISQTINNNLNK
ncbi:MAG: hypothetical protein ACOYOV_09005 [Bacteroidales bacterium]